MNAWIGFDLDGTLAEYSGYHGPDHIGKPIPEMIARVKAHIEAGDEVRIFTARAFEAEPRTIRVIQEWCIQHIGRALPVTCQKDYGMIMLYDDRCKQVVPNKGLLIEDLK